MAVDALDVDLTAAARAPLLERGTARVADSAGGHPRHAGGGGTIRTTRRSPSCSSPARRRRFRARPVRPEGSRRRAPARPPLRRSGRWRFRRRESCTRAAQKSSNPSEKQMFLKPTAKPTPRRTPSPRVVFPAPPGRRIGSRGSGSGSGTGIAAAARITSAIGRDPVSTWPVGSVSPGSSAFSSRSSTGSMPSASASGPSAPPPRSRPAPRRSRASPRTAGCSCRRPRPR